MTRRRGPGPRPPTHHHYQLRNSSSTNLLSEMLGSDEVPPTLSSTPAATMLESAQPPATHSRPHWAFPALHGVATHIALLLDVLHGAAASWHVLGWDILIRSTS
jgi:hypothetical protein